MSEFFQNVNAFFLQSAWIWFVCLAVLFFKANKLIERHGELIDRHNERIDTLEMWKRNS